MTGAGSDGGGRELPVLVYIQLIHGRNVRKVTGWLGPSLLGGLQEASSFSVQGVLLLGPCDPYLQKHLSVKAYKDQPLYFYENGGGRARWEHQ